MSQTPDVLQLPVPSQPAENSTPKQSSPPSTGGMLDVLLVGLALVIAFLIASFPATNSDLWLHLATGRLLAQGEYFPGHEPFAATTAGVSWINFSWGSDLLLYAGFATLGGAGLVVLKALGVVALTALLLFLRPSGTPVAIWYLLTLIGLLALAPWLLVQSSLLSMLFLALALHLLQRNQRGHQIALLGMMVLWVNLDRWFFLGPLTVLLYWIGERLTTPRRENAVPMWLVAASLACMLVSPYHVKGLRLPVEFSLVGLSSEITQDPRFSAIFRSPLSKLNNVALLKPGDWAFLGLLLLGPLSFALNRKAFPRWRVLLWISLAGLACWRERAIPFFTIVAIPITAWNLSEVLGPRRLGRLGQLSLAGLGLGLIAVLTLGVLPGETGPVRLGWKVEPDSAFQNIAETYARWTRAGLLDGDSPVFNTDPESAPYLAWFAPGTRWVIDHRLELFTRTAGNYLTVCDQLLPSDRVPAGDVQPWQEFFREYRLRTLVVQHPNPSVIFETMTRFLAEQNQWTLLHIGGNALIYGWEEPGTRTSPLASLRFDANRLAFGLASEMPIAPEKQPPATSAARGLLANLTRPPAETSWESGASGLYLRYFQDRTPFYANQGQMRGWGTFSAGLTGLAAPPGFGLLGMPFRLRDPGPFLLELQARPPALLLLAVRAARTAVASNPRDANAYLRLGQAYLNLRDLTIERSREGRLPALTMLRHLQAISAFREAVRLDPRLELGHELLVVLHAERQHMDLALSARQRQLEAIRKNGPQPAESEDGYRRRLTRLERETGEFERQVQDRQNRLAVRSRTTGSSDPLTRAEAALELGLAKLALDDILLPSRVELFGTAGAKLELGLLLTSGRAEEARAILEDEQVQSNRNRLLGYELSTYGTRGAVVLRRYPAYDWLRVCQAAALGDYAQAEESLRSAITTIGDAQAASLRQIRRALPLSLASELGTRTVSGHLLPHLVSFDARSRVEQELNLVLDLQAERQELHLIGALLALEQGNLLRADQHLREILADKPVNAEEISFTQLIARTYAQLLEQQRLLSAREGKPQDNP